MSPWAVIVRAFVASVCGSLFCNELYVAGCVSFRYQGSLSAISSLQMELINNTEDM
jgi:hypothetical protein